MHFENASFEIFETGTFIWEKAQSRHGSTQQLGEEQWDNTTQLLLVPLLGTHQSTPTNVH